MATTRKAMAKAKTKTTAKNAIKARVGMTKHGYYVYGASMAVNGQAPIYRASFKEAQATANNVAEKYFKEKGKAAVNVIAADGNGNNAIIYRVARTPKE